MSVHRLLSVPELLELREPSWLIDSILPARSLGMLWGPPNVGKSFVTLDMACSVAVGNAWLGKPTTEGDVIYIASEGVISFKRRVQAWLRYNALTDDDLSRLQFVPWTIKLHEGITSLARQIGSQSLVIIDTFAAATLGLDESTGQGVGPAIESLQQLRHDCGAAVLLVHHTGWERSHERGSSHLRGVMDVSIEMTGARLPSKKPIYDTDWEYDARRTGRTLVCWKQRDASKFSELAIELQEVEWWERWPRRSLVVVPR